MDNFLFLVMMTRHDCNTCSGDTVHTTYHSSTTPCHTLPSPPHHTIPYHTTPRHTLPTTPYPTSPPTSSSSTAHVPIVSSQLGSLVAGGPNTPVTRQLGAGYCFGDLFWVVWSTLENEEEEGEEEEEEEECTCDMCMWE